MAENFIKRPQYKGQTPQDRRTDQHLEKSETSHAHSLRFFSDQISGRVLGISSDRDDRMEPKVKTQENP